MYTLLIDDTANALEPRGASRKTIDEALEDKAVSREFDVDQRAIDAAAAKDAMFGGASY